MIAYILGNIIRIEAALLAVPAFVSIWYQEAKAASAFVATIIACLMVGTVLVSREPENKRIYWREGFVVVALSWIVMSVLGALPFYLSGSISGYVNCFFETALPQRAQAFCRRLKLCRKVFSSGVALRIGLAVWGFWYLCLQLCPLGTSARCI